MAHPNKDDEDEDNHDALIADHNDHVLHFQRRLNVQEHESDELSRPVFPPSKAAVVRYLRDLFPPVNRSYFFALWNFTRKLLFLFFSLE